MSDETSKRPWWRTPKAWPRQAWSPLETAWRWLKDYAANDTIKLAVIIWAASVIWLISLFIDVHSLPWFPFFELSLDGLVLIRPESQAEDLRNLLWALSFVGGALAAVIALINALRRTRMMQREQDAEIFAKAVEQLGSKSEAVRLGAVYALEGLMRLDFGAPGRDGFIGRQIGETLAAFVRGHPYELIETLDDDEKSDPRRLPRLPTDLEAAIAVLTRSWPSRFRTSEEGERYVDLRGASLRGLLLPYGTDLSWFNLSGSDLSHADLSGANFTNADLAETDFSNATLSGSDLSMVQCACAIFSGARLDYVQSLNGVFVEARFNGAHLAQTEWEQCRFELANFSGAELGEAKFAVCWFLNNQWHRAEVSGADFASRRKMSSPSMVHNGYNKTLGVSVDALKLARWNPETPPVFPEIDPASS